MLSSTLKGSGTWAQCVHVCVCMCVFVCGGKGGGMDEFGLKVGDGLGMVGWGRVTSIEERRERRESVSSRDIPNGKRG